MSDNKLCSSCSASLPPNAAFCGKCGAKIADPNPESESDATGTVSGNRNTAKAKQQVPVKHPWTVHVAALCAGLAAWRLHFFIKEIESISAQFKEADTVTLALVILIVVFLVTAIGMECGKKWARENFTWIAVSFAVFLCWSLHEFHEEVVSKNLIVGNPDVLSKAKTLIYWLVIGCVFAWLPASNVWFRAVEKRKANPD